MSSSSPTIPSPPKDQHTIHVWLLEPPTINTGGVLTIDGCEQIAQHQYKAGLYTSLDTLLNPWWTKLVEFLPLWLAPNLVTTIGGMCCVVSYLLSVYYLNHQSKSTEEEDTFPSDNPIPRWLYVWNAFALFAYYTLDCMDGKQARRTQSSSPLGQLFDHGIDAMGNLSHVQVIQCIVQLPPPLLVTLQCSLQTAFFQAQWEEYYTGSLVHATGNVGVTEVTYGMALWSLITGIFGRDLYERPVFTIDDAAISTTSMPSRSRWQSLLLWWTGGNLELQVRHVAALCWIFLILGLTTLSFIRVYQHVQGNLKIFFSAVSKLALGPWILSFIGIVVNQQSTLALGLAFCWITIKIIVFSMARMAFASIQVVILPFVLFSVWFRFSSHNEWLTENMRQYLEWALDLYYLISISMWAHRAITQLCEKLQIKLFRITATKQD